MKFSDRYIKFMKDRYGIDELYKFLLLICFVLLVINTFVSNNIIRLFEVLLIVIIFYRYMSKNIKLRKKENDKYLEIKDKIIKLFDYNKKKYKDRNFSDNEAQWYAEEDLMKEISDAVQTFNYQINSMSTTNGQAPFLSVNMWVGENPEYEWETKLLISEFLFSKDLNFI